MRYGRHCQHEFVDAKTGSAVEPVVNVLASSHAACMTLGHKYRCVHCDRIIDLRARARLPLPERPVDLRARPVVAANDDRHDVERAPAARASGAPTHRQASTAVV